MVAASPLPDLCAKCAHFCRPGGRCVPAGRGGARLWAVVGAVVIVGAGRCGASAAETLRGAGFDGRVVLVGDEAEPPYERPPLSKAFLAGAQDAADLSVHPRSWYADSGVELRTAVAVTGLDCRSRLALLSDGSQVGFDRLLPATGGRPRLLPGSSSLQRVRYLRTLADATSLRSSLTAASHVVVVGAGFIGAEVAASARSLGVSVTLLEMLEVPLARVLGSEVGAAYADLHRAHGVRLLTGEGLASVQECDDGAVRVRTTRDRDLECDLVVVGVGIEPRDELAAAAGLTVSNGVLVDEYCRTSVPFVYAAGDVANHFHPLSGTHIRVEHYDIPAVPEIIGVHHISSGGQLRHSHRPKRPRRWPWRCRVRGGNPVDRHGDQDPCLSSDSGGYRILRGTWEQPRPGA